ncbi:MAG: hypothetical protein ACLFWL_10185 [Candidatus Brocadiia bacterium]
MPWINETMAGELHRISPNLRMVSMSTRCPPPNVSSVLLDAASLGHLTYKYAISKRVRALVFVVTQYETIEGFRAASEQRKSEANIDLDVLRAHQAVEPETDGFSERILELKPDLVAFDDDRLADRCLAELIELDPEFFSHCEVISHANESENLLPAPVARMVVDSYEIGEGAIQLLHRMIEENRSLHTVTLIQPRLQEPPEPGNP